MAFHWRADDGLLILVFGSSTKKRCQIWTPSSKTFRIRACLVYFPRILYIKFGFVSLVRVVLEMIFERKEARLCRKEARLLAISSERFQAVVSKCCCSLFIYNNHDKKNASAGNRTRAARVAGEHSTTEPPMLTHVSLPFYFF